MGKHVIFLGAGASKTSGYPLAEQLRKEWLVSSEILRSKLQKTIGNGAAARLGGSVERFNSWIQPVEGALKLFRQGGFGTIDEFCYLIRHERKNEVISLKEVLRFVFGLNDPEADFVKSDYYGFIPVPSHRRRTCRCNCLRGSASRVAVGTGLIADFLGTSDFGGKKFTRAVP